MVSGTLLCAKHCCSLFSFFNECHPFACVYPPKSRAYEAASWCPFKLDVPQHTPVVEALGPICNHMPSSSVRPELHTVALSVVFRICLFSQACQKDVKTKRHPQDVDRENLYRPIAVGWAGVGRQVFSRSSSSKVCSRSSSRSTGVYAGRSVCGC